MHIGIIIDATLPPRLYGGTERVVIWLGRALTELGHKVTYFAGPGSRLDFAACELLQGPISATTARNLGIDIFHVNSGSFPDQTGVPFCSTMHGNDRNARVLHENTIFVSQDHARRHGGSAFVHNGMDERDYPAPDLDARGGNFTFLAKAAWKVKNVKGAIDVARKAGAPIDILGGSRVNFKMGFRLTLDPNARFHGMVDDKTKSRYLRPSRGMIFPVLWDEPFGVAVTEAFYFGVPVFATPYGALPELVTPEAGYLSASASELAEAARRAESYNRRAIHAHWQKHFTARTMALKYMEYYQRILDGETLHPGPINAPPTRVRELKPWLA